jgi:hypothetical protein
MNISNVGRETTKNSFGHPVYFSWSAYYAYYERFHIKRNFTLLPFYLEDVLWFGKGTSEFVSALLLSLPKELHPWWFLLPYSAVQGILSTSGTTRKVHQRRH